MHIILTFLWFEVTDGKGTVGSQGTLISQTIIVPQLGQSNLRFVESSQSEVSHPAKPRRAGTSLICSSSLKPPGLKVSAVSVQLRVRAEHQRPNMTSDRWLQCLRVIRVNIMSPIWQKAVIQASLSNKNNDVRCSYSRQKLQERLISVLNERTVCRRGAPLCTASCRDLPENKHEWKNGWLFKPPWMCALVWALLLLHSLNLILSMTFGCFMCSGWLSVISRQFAWTTATESAAESLAMVPTLRKHQGKPNAWKVIRWNPQHLQSILLSSLTWQQKVKGLVPYTLALHSFWDVFSENQHEVKENSTKHLHLHLLIWGEKKTPTDWQLNCMVKLWSHYREMAAL